MWQCNDLTPDSLIPYHHAKFSPTEVNLPMTPPPQQLCQWFMKASFQSPISTRELTPPPLSSSFPRFPFPLPLFLEPQSLDSQAKMSERPCRWVGTLFGTSFCEISKVDSLVGVGHKWIRSFGTFWDSRVSFRIC